MTETTFCCIDHATTPAGSAGHNLTISVAPLVAAIDRLAMIVQDRHEVKIDLPPLSPTINVTPTPIQVMPAAPVVSVTVPDFPSLPPNPPVSVTMPDFPPWPSPPAPHPFPPIPAATVMIQPISAKLAGIVFGGIFFAEIVTKWGIPWAMRSFLG